MKLRGLHQSSKRVISTLKINVDPEDDNQQQECKVGRATSQAVSCRPLTAESWDRFQATFMALGHVLLKYFRFPCRYHSTNGFSKHFCFPRHYHSTNAPYPSSITGSNQVWGFISLASNTLQKIPTALRE